MVTLHIQQYYFFFFNDTATTEIYTLSLHDALPISETCSPAQGDGCASSGEGYSPRPPYRPAGFDQPLLVLQCYQERGRSRSEEHTSELQSRQYLVCRLLLEKKNNIKSRTVFATVNS